MLTGLPPGPSGIDDRGNLVVRADLRGKRRHLLALGDVHRDHLVGSPISSSATEILRPFGVFQVCSSMVIFGFPTKAWVSVPGTSGPYKPRFPRAPLRKQDARTVDGTRSALECPAKRR